MSTLSIPIELYQPIFSHLHTTSPKDLHSLLRTTRSCRLEAERVLYHDIFIGATCAHRDLLQELISSPRKALYVVQLSVCVPSSNTPESELWKNLAVLLKMAKRLKRLDISTRGRTRDLGWVLPSALSAPGGVFQLESFSCDFTYDAHLLAFFASQKQLNTLSWFGSVPVVTTDVMTKLEQSGGGAVLPKLTTLAGNPHDIHKISSLRTRPGRQTGTAVERLWWGTDSNDHKFECVLGEAGGDASNRPTTPSGRSLRSLVLGPYVSLDVLRLIPEVCPSLEFVQCSYLERVRLLDFVGLHPSLREVKINVLPGSMLNEECAALAKEMFERSKTLQAFQLEDMRWTRDCDRVVRKRGGSEDWKLV